MAPTHPWGAPAVSKCLVLPWGSPEMACRAFYSLSAEGALSLLRQLGDPLTLHDATPTEGVEF